MPSSDTTPQPDSTRSKLIAVALEMFLERGYEGTSLTAIANQLNIKGPAVYYHFKSKLDLLYEAHATYTTGMLENLERATARGTATDRLQAFVRIHTQAQFRFVPGGKPRYVFAVAQLLRLLEGERREHLVRLSRRVLDLLREIIRQGIAEDTFEVPDPTTTAFAIIGMNHHLAKWYSPDGRTTPDRLAELQAEMALRMVGAPPRRRRRAATRSKRR